MTNLPDLTVKQLRRVIAVKERIESLEAKIASIVGEKGGTQKAAKAGRRKRKMSAATKAKLSAKARVRWAKAKAAGKSRL